MAVASPRERQTSLVDRFQCSVRLIGGRRYPEAQDTGRVWTNDRLTAHPDTVITILMYLQRTLNSFGMQYTHLTVDLQLYQTACLIQWDEPLCWTNVILHPGMMHALMSFLGCIGTLMKASCVDILIGAAFAGITSIVNDKAWANALLEWCQDICGAVCLPGDNQGTPNWEAMGGLPYQTKTCLQITLESRHISSEGMVLEVWRAFQRAPSKWLCWWIVSVCAHLDIAIEHTYNEDGRIRSHMAE